MSLRLRPAASAQANRVGVAFAVAIALLASAAGARAGEPTAAEKREAGERFDRGIKLFDDGNFSSALAEFQAGYRAVPSYRFLLNIGLCEKRLFRYNDAIVSLRRYLDEGGADVSRDRREQAERELAEIGRLVAEVTVRVDGAPAEVDVDGRAAGRTPLGGPLLLGPGHHVVRAVREGDEPAQKELDVVSGDRALVVLAPHPRPKVATTATLAVTTRPPGAELSVDGRFAGKEPWSGTLDPGGHEVRAQLGGYEKLRAEVVLTAGQHRELALELVPLSPAASSVKWYKRWYVWTPVAVIVAGGIAVAGVEGYVATHPGPDLSLDFRRLP